MENKFFKKRKVVKINDILSCLNLEKKNKNFRVNDIKDLDLANKNDISFFNSKKYLHFLNKTKSNLIIVEKKNISLLPKKKNLLK